MSLGNLLAFSPELWVLGGALITLGLGWVRHRRAGQAEVAVALLALAGAFGALVTQFRSRITILDGAFVVDGTSVFVSALLLAAAALSLLLGWDADGLERRGGHFAGFVLLATLGAMLTVSAADMVSLFLALELLSVNLYLMVALPRREPESAEAGIVFLVMGLAGSAVLLYGLAIVYGLTGVTSLAAAGKLIAARSPTEPALLLGLALILAGFAFKLGVAPLHWWVSRVYERAPLPVVAYLSSAGLAAGATLFLRVLLSTAGGSRARFALVLAVLAAVTMTFGNLAALSQTSLRRLLGYTSIGQAGYVLAAAAVLRQGGVAAALLFVVTLAVTNLAAVGAVIAYSERLGSDRLADLAGMSRNAPALALAMGLAFASLIGLPPLAGFFGKTFVLVAAVQGGYAWLGLFGLLNVALAALVLLRVVKVAYFDPSPYELERHRGDRLAGAGLAVAAAGVVFLGAFLGPLSSAAGYGASALLR